MKGLLTVYLILGPPNANMKTVGVIKEREKPENNIMTLGNLEILCSL